MGGLMSRNKGKRGEREVIELLQPIVNAVYARAGMEVPKLQRNTLQSDGGGFDIAGLEWLALEVKFQETLSVNQWWAQTLEQANGTQCPVLIYRQSRQPWRVKMFVEATACGVRYRLPATLELDEFLGWFQLRLTEELTR